MRRRSVALLLLVLAAGAEPAAAQRLDGFNVIVKPGHPFGSPSARKALAAAQRVGAKAVTVVPFLWQRDPQSAEIVRGSDMHDAELRLAIREARALGLKVMVKPHVWVEGNWAGAVSPGSPDGWHVWFGRYRAEIVRIAKLAAVEQADALAIGTELKLTSQRPEWRELIAATRAAFPRTLTYCAHNTDEAETVPFWDALDQVCVTLWPVLGADQDEAARREAMRATGERLDALAERTGKPVIVGEVGLRSAKGAAEKPWQSAEERAAEPDLGLQATVVADWLAALDRPAVQGVLVWRWFTDPDAGGPADTDFTVQGKAAERVIACAWAGAC